MLSLFPTGKTNTGFSLIEMAMVLFIVSLLLGGLLMSLSTTREITSRTDAEVQINLIMEALYGFAQANGRLPCPAIAGSAGAEDPAGGGACTRWHGFVPAATLGLAGPVNEDSLLMDDWLSPYRYSVSDDGGSDAFTTTNGMQAAGMAALDPDLRVCAEAACTTVLAEGVPAVVMSLGADWADFTSVDEVANSGEITVAGYRHANNLDFVSTGYIEDSFDDLISWLSANVLYTRMIAAGQLP